MRKSTRRGFLSLLVLLSCIPGAEANERRVLPTKAKWKQAFFSALRNPGTWAPAAGAALISAGDYDAKISRWAVTNTPVFGSVEQARRASTELRTATHATMIGTALVPPDGGGSWGHTGMRLGIQHGAAIATTSTSAVFKSLTDRPRPDGSNNESFPSSHSSRAFSYAASARRNLQASGLPKPARTSLGIGVTALAAGTAWGRVEGGVHYPSDVLAGAALGNFMALFINDTFLGARQDMQVHIEVTPELKQVSLSWSF